MVGMGDCRAAPETQTDFRCFRRTVRKGRAGEGWGMVFVVEMLLDSLFPFTTFIFTFFAALPSEPLKVGYPTGLD